MALARASGCVPTRTLRSLVLELLFRVVTLEDWTDIMYINMYGCDMYTYEFKQDLCTSPQSHPLEAALFFTSFVVLGTMIILNLFIAVIVDSIGTLKSLDGGPDPDLHQAILDELAALRQELRKRG